VGVFGLTNAVAVAAGGGHTCALLADDTGRCWGANGSGELGNGTTSVSRTPTTVAGGGGSVTARAVAAGGSHTCALRANSTISCWGHNFVGQLGDGTTTDRSSPVSVSGLTNAVAIVAGGFHTCAILAAGTARCWGANNQGELGDGTTTSRLSPVSVSGLTNAVAVAAGGTHTCALLADGKARCWGANDSGQVGAGHTSPLGSPPVSVTGLTNAVAITAGADHTCALLADGTVRCWGRNSEGQLGDGTTTDRSSPVSVAGLSNAVAITAGADHTCALLADGTARCWGFNTDGELGEGTSSLPRSVPSTVSGLTNAGGIAGGANHTCALAAAGNEYCWGYNVNGQLGDNTTSQRLTPVAVKVFVRVATISQLLTLGSVAQISAGDAGGQSVGDSGHSCAVIADGSLRCWGDNPFGEIGDGTSGQDRLTATAVPSFTLNIDPAVTLRRKHRAAKVNVIATCAKGRTLHVTVKLLQRRASGSGTGDFRCAGRLRLYPVTVRAHGHHGFVTGAARVTARAIIRRHRVVVDRQRWTRAVSLSLCARRGPGARGFCRRG
jgi:alpha-tubulin suppressor-like RCC1 family protein